MPRRLASTSACTVTGVTVPLESRLQRQIIAALEAEGYYVCNVVVAGRAGTADLLVCAKGRFIALEVKTPAGRVSPLQVLENKRVLAAGGAGFVVRSVGDALACVRSEVSERYVVQRPV